MSWSERAWAEYLAWTRGAADGQYEATEAKAWERLQAAHPSATVEPLTLELPPEPEAGANELPPLSSGP